MVDVPWTTYPFEDVIDFREGPGILAKDFRTTGVPLIRLSGLEGGVSVLNGCNYLDPDMVRQRWSHFGVRKGDILLSTSATLGRIAVVTAEGVGAIPYTGIIRMRPKDKRLDGLFIRYLLEGDDFQAQAEKMGAGSVIRHFGPLHLRQMILSLPPILTQHKIAAILSAYDDLIENNLRRIKILEEMAQNLYAEWFVKFRFPGHEKVKMVDSPLGKTPEGWEIKIVKDIVIRLKAKKVYEQHDVMETGNIMVIDQSSNEFLGFHDDDADLIASSSFPIIIFGDHTCKIQLLIKPFSIGPNVVPFTAKDGQSTYYLFSLIHNLVETREYKRHWTELANKEVVYSHSIITKQFDNYVEPLFRQVDILRSQVLILHRTRNLLLPKLISGEYDVSDLDIKTGDDE